MQRQKMVTTVTVQSYREGMTVTIPPDHNHHFPRSRKPIRLAIRHNLNEILGEDYVIGSISRPTMRRGEYKVTIWRNVPSDN